MDKIKIIARGSELSRVQVQEVTGNFNTVAFISQFIDSLGDKDKNTSLMDSVPADFFTREIDQAILTEKADIAIHSAKDLPYPLPKGLEVIALTEATDKTDTLTTKKGYTLKTLPTGSVVGTSSAQRKQQLLEARPDLEVKSIRGTIQERIQQMDDGNYDAVIIATCALKRLGLKKRLTDTLPFETHPLQGNLAIVAKEGSIELKEFFKTIDVRKNYGKGYIVGAGPGDPELITVKAKRIIRKADVILYDNLANPILLKDTSAQNIYVGKRKGDHAYTQDEINALFYKYVAEGKVTIRLKGGDPMIFGRGGEEFDYMRERLTEVEVIPGISAAIGASSVSAIPLTYRNKSASVSFMTGYPENKIAFPDTDTLVYYMGASNAHKIAGKLIEKGRKPETPVAIVKSATLPTEEKQFTTLKELADKKVLPESPSVLIIGEVATENNYSKSEITKPSILFTGTDSSKYQHLGNIIHTPLISIEPIFYNKRSFDQIATQQFDYVIFTSKYSVKYFMRSALNAQYDSRWFHNKKIISIGNTTSKALRAHFIQPDVQVSLESSTGIINWFKENKVHNKKVLIPRSNKGLDYLPDELSALNLDINIVHVYKNVLPKNVYKQNLNNIDAIIFTSPSTVENFIHLYDSIPPTVKIISRGEQTSKKLKALGFEPSAISNTLFQPTNKPFSKDEQPIINYVI